MSETEDRPRLTIRAVMAIVAIDYGVKYSALLSHVRTRQVLEPRHVAMWLAAKHLPVSYPVIGRCFGDRDHTTVLHACGAIDKRAALEPDFAERLDRLGIRIAALEAAIRAEPICVEQTGDGPRYQVAAYVPRGMGGLVEAVNLALAAHAWWQQSLYGDGERLALRSLDESCRHLAAARNALAAERSAA